jgi:small subunit ribosomal protein S1
VGDEVEVKILKVDSDARKIGLSLRRVRWAAEEEAAAESGRKSAPSGPEKVLSDADADQFRKQQHQTDENQIDADEPVSSDDTQQGEEPEVAAEAPQDEGTQDPPQTDTIAETPQESDQAPDEQPEQSPDTEQTDDDTGIEPEKT